MHDFKTFLYIHNNVINVAVESMTLNQYLVYLNEVAPEHFTFGIWGNGVFNLTFKNDNTSKMNMYFEMDKMLIGQFESEEKKLKLIEFITEYAKERLGVKLYQQI